MAYFPDFARHEPLPSATGTLHSIGWLDRDHEYERGAVSPDFFRALVRLLRDPWQPAATAGRFPCPFCRFTGGPGSLRFEADAVTLGANRLFVPASRGGVFVAPSLVAHYVDAHDYRAPEEFQADVLACPEMGSSAYRKALREHGLEVRVTRDGA